MFFLFKQKTAYEMRISDWSSDVCSSDLLAKCLQHRALDRSDQPRLRDVRVGEAQRVAQVVAVDRRKPSIRSDGAADRGGRRGRELGSASGRERVCQYV